MFDAKLFVPGSAICEVGEIEVEVVDEESAIKNSEDARKLREDYAKKGLKVLSEFKIKKEQMQKLKKLIECFENDEFVVCIVYTKDKNINK